MMTASGERGARILPESKVAIAKPSWFARRGEFTSGKRKLLVERVTRVIGSHFNSDSDFQFSGAHAGKYRLPRTKRRPREQVAR